MNCSSWEYSSAWHIVHTPGHIFSTIPVSSIVMNVDNHHHIVDSRILSCPSKGYCSGLSPDFLNASLYTTWIVHALYVIHPLKIFLAHLNKLFSSYDIATRALHNFKKDHLHLLTDSYVLAFSRYWPKQFCLRTLFAPIRHSPIYNLCISS